MPRDSQRKRLYNWENTFVAMMPPEPKTATQSILSPDDMRYLMDFIYEDFGLTFQKPEVCSHRGRRRAFYRPSSHTVNFPKQSTSWFRQKWVFVHELAHAIETRLWNEASHGAKFCGVYAALLAYISGIEEARIITSMRQSGRLRVMQWRTI